MTRMSAFNSPFLLGFDHFERALDRITKASTESYPPYNIVQTGSNGLRITLAVAGFGPEALEVLVEGNQLQIRGRQSEEAERVFVHRGIATRQFQRSFVLAEGLKVSAAMLGNGLLHVDLVRPEPEAGIQRIAITTVS